MEIRDQTEHHRRVPRQRHTLHTKSGSRSSAWLALLVCCQTWMHAVHDQFAVPKARLGQRSEASMTSPLAGKHEHAIICDPSELLWRGALLSPTHLASAALEWACHRACHWTGWCPQRMRIKWGPNEFWKSSCSQFAELKATRDRAHNRLVIKTFGVPLTQYREHV